MDFLDVFPLLIESLLYGIFVVLTVIAVHHLRARKRTNSNLNIAFIVLLFVMDTVHIVLGYSIGFRGLSFHYPVSGDGGHNPLVAFVSGDLQTGFAFHMLVAYRVITYLLMSAVADAILLYRTYIIWAKRMRIIIPLAALYVVTMAISLSLLPARTGATYAYVATYFWAALTTITNLLCTGLIAGRIWWAKRQASNIIGSDMSQRYTSTAVILVESGVLYPIALIINGILSARAIQGSQDFDWPWYVSVTFTWQAVCIAPALILVRVGLGISSDEHATSRTLSKFTPAQAPFTHTDTVIEITSPVSGRRNENF